MNVVILKEAKIDVDDAVCRLCGDTQLYERFLRKFLKDQSMFKLIEAARHDDVEAAFRSAHALKGLAGNLSIKPLYEKLLPLVESLRAGDGIDITKKVNEVSILHGTLVEAINLALSDG